MLRLGADYARDSGCAGCGLAKQMHNRDGLIEDCRLAQNVLCDTTAIDTELTELFREIEVVTELSRKAIYENARSAVDQKEWTERNNDQASNDYKNTNDRTIINICLQINPLIINGLFFTISYSVYPLI